MKHNILFLILSVPIITTLLCSYSQENFSLQSGIANNIKSSEPTNAIITDTPENISDKINKTFETYNPNIIKPYICYRTGIVEKYEYHDFIKQEFFQNDILRNKMSISAEHFLPFENFNLMRWSIIGSTAYEFKLDNETEIKVWCYYNNYKKFDSIIDYNYDNYFKEYRDIEVMPLSYEDYCKNYIQYSKELFNNENLTEIDESFSNQNVILNNKLIYSYYNGFLSSINMMYDDIVISISINFSNDEYDTSVNKWEKASYALSHSQTWIKNLTSYNTALKAQEDFTEKLRKYEVQFNN